MHHLYQYFHIIYSIFIIYIDDRYWYHHSEVFFSNRGAIVWDPYTTCTSDINKLERIQRRAARFITGDYKTREEGSVTKMLNDLKLQNLQLRKTSLRLVFLYKLVLSSLLMSLVHVVYGSHTIAPRFEKKTSEWWYQYLSSMYIINIEYMSDWSKFITQ
jgi:hypothetical protein